MTSTPSSPVSTSRGVFAARQPGRARLGDPNIVALLSLKLLLLAFFILLNALAQLEEDRTRAVLESVNEAFNGRIRASESYVDHPAAVGPLPDSEVLIGEIGRLFDSMVPAVETVVSADRPTLRLEMPAAGMFEPDKAEYRSGRRLLLRRFAAALLHDRKAGLTYQVEVLHGVPAGTMGRVADAGARSLELRRVGMLVGDLIDRGLAPTRLSLGVLPGRPDVVRFVVRLFDTDPPPLSFSGQAG